MELILRPYESFLKKLKWLIQQRGGNIYYEETPIDVDTTTAEVLHNIIKEKGETPPIDLLVIFDKYFTNIPCKSAEKNASIFFEWIRENRIEHVKIYTEKKKNCFESYLRDRSRGKITFEKCPGEVHDRFWLFYYGGNCVGISVGASFNKFENKVFIINKIKKDDISPLLEMLKQPSVPKKEGEG